MKLIQRLHLYLSITVKPLHTPKSCTKKLGTAVFAQLRGYCYYGKVANSLLYTVINLQAVSGVLFDQWGSGKQKHTVSKCDAQALYTAFIQLRCNIQFPRPLVDKIQPIKNKHTCC